MGKKGENIKKLTTRAKAIYDLIEMADAGRPLTAPSKHRQISYCMLIVPLCEMFNLSATQAFTNI